MFIAKGKARYFLSRDRYLGLEVLPAKSAATGCQATLTSCWQAAPNLTLSLTMLGSTQLTWAINGPPTVALRAMAGPFVTFIMVRTGSMGCVERASW